MFKSSNSALITSLNILLEINNVSSWYCTLMLGLEVPSLAETNVLKILFFKSIFDSRPNLIAAKSNPNSSLVTRLVSIVKFETANLTAPLSKPISLYAFPTDLFASLKAL